MMGMADEGLPEKVHFTPVLKWWAIVLGIVVDLAVELVLQQLGVQALEVRGMILGMGRGALIGLLAPNVGALVGVILANRELRGLREGA